MKSKIKEIKTSALDSTISVFMLEKDSEKPVLTHGILKGETKKSFLAFPESTSGTGGYTNKDNIKMTIKTVVKNMGPESERCMLNLYEYN